MSEGTEAIVVDFETEPIEDFPNTIPRAVGVAISWSRRVSRYFGFAHPSKNNSTFDEARTELRKVWSSSHPLAFHNARFDLAVARESFGLERPNWDRVHDTLPLLFLLDPRAQSYGLKESAAAILGRRPSERDAVAAWLTERQPVPGRRITLKNARAWVSLAPCDLVARYAVADCTMTRDLLTYALKRVTRAKMRAAYDRERRLLPVIDDLERHGMHVDKRALRADCDTYTRALDGVDAWIRRRLGAPSLDVDSNSALAQALLEDGCASIESLGVTDKGSPRTSREAIRDGVDDPQLVAVLAYRASVATCLRTFMRPWLATADAHRGVIRASWSSTRNSEHGGLAGARTGRLASSPNFQNLPKVFEPVFRDSEHPSLPRPPVRGLPAPPVVRSYVVPPRGHVLIGRDFNQQELRLLAHFGGGRLLDAYRDDPRLDFHEHVRRSLSEALGRPIARGPVKTINFGILYGMGIDTLAKRLQRPVEEARALKRAVLSVFDEIKELYAEMRRRAAEDAPIRTLGGRLYYVEPPRLVDGVLRTFDYKLVNVLIQGSAADVTKEAMIRCHESALHRHGARLVLTVHDEIVAVVPRRNVRGAMSAMREAMESVECDVPLLSDGYVCASRWSEKTRYVDTR